MDVPTERPFRAVVVGGGITGLVMANALSKAGIDHVFVESRRKIVYPAGGSFGLWPHIGRILDQIGCWDQVRLHSTPLDASYQRDATGKIYKESNIFKQLASR